MRLSDKISGDVASRMGFYPMKKSSALLASQPDMWYVPECMLVGEVVELLRLRNLRCANKFSDATAAHV